MKNILKNENYFKRFLSHIEKTQLTSCKHRIYIGLSITHCKNKTLI
jgi:hypothetical protein